MRKVFTIVLFTGISFCGFSQNDYFIEANGLYGFIVPHHRSIEYLLQKHIPAFEIIAGQKQVKNNFWDSLYVFPQIGVGYQYLDFGNPGILGNANSFFVYERLPLWRPKGNFVLNTRIMFGLAYLNRIFEIEDNYRNIAISSHVNVHIGLCIDAGLRLSDKLSLNAGVRLTHFSNGKLKSPNYGLNVATSCLGITYFFQGKSEKNIHPVERPLLPKWKRELIYSAGLTTISAYERGEYFISTLVFNLIKPIGYKYSYGIGADAFYNPAMRMERQKLENIYDNHRMYSGGLHGMFDINYKKLTMTIQMGTYLYSVVYGTFYPYHRLGLRYQINEHLLANLTLKTHWGVAEYIEWGVGYWW